MSILAHWSNSENAGDQLTPWLIKRITGYRPQHVPSGFVGQPYHVVAGSVLNHAGSGATVWGAGIASANDPIARGLNIKAVRGPHTRKRALNLGLECPEVYGDPGLLVPKWVPRAKTVTHDIGIVPHVVDYLDVCKRVTSRHFKIIRLLDTIESVIEAITSCHSIVSSSLHGVVFAHAYGIETAWAKFSNRVGGDGTKFYDHYESLGMEGFFYDMREEKDFGVFHGMCRRPSPEVVEKTVNKLWGACPFK